MPNNYVIAFYIRLSEKDRFFSPESTENAEKKESNSITNQKKLLYEFVACRPEFHGSSIIEKIDDGYTGINFQRPGFQELMEMVIKREVNCIIVKDFSRFGRDYVELGNYLEQLFPLLEVRFISINDSYDSAYSSGSGGELDIGFKNLVYEMYSRDLSAKVKQVLREKQKKGQYLSGCPLYGYRHSKENRHRLVVDEEPARIVREIFQMRSTGMTFERIAGNLNDRKIPTPAEYHYKKYKRKYGGKKNYDADRKSFWTKQVIHRIIKEERYTGVMISHKHEAFGIKGPNRCVPKNEWIRVEGTHEAIISKELFKYVQPHKDVF